MKAGALALGLALAPVAASAACDRPEHRQLDFWIGRWAVAQTKSGAPVGQSLIEPIHGGCAIRESWSQRGFSGGSLNAFDATADRWRQAWTDSTGAWREFVGGAQDGAMVLVSTSQTGAGATLIRIRISPNPDGSVRQYSDRSEDTGTTWVERYDFTYRKAEP